MQVEFAMDINGKWKCSPGEKRMNFITKWKFLPAEKWSFQTGWSFPTAFTAQLNLS